MDKYILASASPRRRELLEQIGLKFRIFVTDADESKIDKNLPVNLYVEELAMAKAAAAAKVLKNEKDAIIIAADTVVYFDNRIMGKPKDEKEAFDMLTCLSGNMHEVCTGVCVMRISDGFSASGCERTEVYFNELSPEKIQRYIDTGEPMDKAGAYGIQGVGALLVKKIIGDYFNVVGLPLSKLSKILENDFGKNLIDG